MTKEKKQSLIIRKVIKYIITILTIIITMLSTFAFATSSETIFPTKDITTPRGKIEIVGATRNNGTNYVNSNEVDVEIIAQDDNEGTIKYYLSKTEISNTTEIAEDDWKTYRSGVTEKLKFDEGEGTYTLYLVLKDEAGNTNIAYSGSNVEYTIEYNKNSADAKLFT